MKINYKKLFKLYCSGDDPRFKEPFKQGDHYIATDSHTMVYMPCEKAELKFKDQNIDKITDLLNIKKNMNVEIDVARLEKNLVPEMINKSNEAQKECPECDGLGDVEYIYDATIGKTYELREYCPICDGSGSITVEEEEKEVFIINEEKTYILNNAIYKYKYIKQLIDAAKIIGAKKIVQTSGNSGTDYKISRFEMGNDITILMAPVYSFGFDKRKIPVVFLNSKSIKNERHRNEIEQPTQV